MAREHFRYLQQKTTMNFKNALDVGTHFGYLVKFLNGAGCGARGIEADEDRVAQAVTGNVEHGYFDPSFKTDERFDLVCFNDMLYCLPNGMDILRHARTLLADRGMILVATINPYSSLIKIYPGTGPGIECTNCLLSKKNFESLDGMEMVDYSCFRSDMLIDMQHGRRYKFPLYRAGLKKVNTFDVDGNKMYVLLKKK